MPLAIEPLEVDDAYDDERIAYRQSRVRLDYYHYHRWSAPPGVLVANALERSLERSGRFRAVVRDQAGVRRVRGGRGRGHGGVDGAQKQLGGRHAHPLHLRDSDTGEVIWSADLEEREPLRAQTPEGLARALSAATTRLAARIAPQLAATAQRRPPRVADSARERRRWPDTPPAVTAARAAKPAYGHIHRRHTPCSRS